MKGPILAAAPPSLNEDWWKQLAPSRNEFGLIFIAIAVIAVLALIWAVFIRKREGDRPNRYSYPRGSGSEKNGASNDSGSGRQRRRKRKRRHRRNPTLAETGGLPPLRSEGMPDDPP
jgi:hypothetical protein